MNDDMTLFILDSANPKQAVVLARHGVNMAIEPLPCDELAELLEFRDRIDQAMRGNQKRPTSKDLAAYGERLFRFAIRGDVQDLYSKLPDSLVRIAILSNRSEIQGLPWEYWRDSKKRPAPRRDRSIVRVVPTIGVDEPKQLTLDASSKIRILFVYADPTDQDEVSWPEVKEKIDRTFRARLPATQFELVTIEGRRKIVNDNIANANFETFFTFGAMDCSNWSIPKTWEISFCWARNPTKAMRLTPKASPPC